MPVNFLSESEHLHLSQFPSSIIKSDIICYFTLSKEDLVQVKRQRKSYNCLGFATQLCALRYLSFSPDNLGTSFSLNEITKKVFFLKRSLEKLYRKTAVTA